MNCWRQLLSLSLSENITWKGGTRLKENRKLTHSRKKSMGNTRFPRVDDKLSRSRFECIEINRRLTNHLHWNSLISLHARTCRLDIRRPTSAHSPHRNGIFNCWANGRNNERITTANRWNSVQEEQPFIQVCESHWIVTIKREPENSRNWRNETKKNKTWKRFLKLS